MVKIMFRVCLYSTHQFIFQLFYQILTSMMTEVVIILYSSVLQQRKCPLLCQLMVPTKQECDGCQCVCAWILFMPIQYSVVQCMSTELHGVTTGSILFTTAVHAVLRHGQLAPLYPDLPVSWTLLSICCTHPSWYVLSCSKSGIILGGCRVLVFLKN